MPNLKISNNAEIVFTTAFWMVIYCKRILTSFAINGSVFLYLYFCRLFTDSLYRFASTFLQEARNAVFARIDQSFQRQLNKETFKPVLHASAEAELASLPHVDDLILWNEQGELTEAIAGNIVLQINGRWVTPSVNSGLLDGVYRTRLLALGSITEQVLTKDDLSQATDIALINSIHKWGQAQWVNR